MPTELIRKQFLLTKEENAEIEKVAQNKGLSVSNLTRILHGLEPLKKGVPNKNDEMNKTKSRLLKARE